MNFYKIFSDANKNLFHAFITKTELNICLSLCPAIVTFETIVQRPFNPNIRLLSLCFVALSSYAPEMK